MEEEFDPQHFGITPELFNEWRAPKFGNANPQKIKSSVWEWLVRSKLSAYGARQQMNDPSISAGAPTWSFDRFGQSTSELPDGRTIYIGGEHEDFYDPDFYIYNDVVVTHRGGNIDFYCYRKSDFPPTDFHTATLVDDIIVIIGSLGYQGARKLKETQLYLLRLDDFGIHKVQGSGTSPGWIHRHMAALSEDGKSIIITKGKVEIEQGNSLKENFDDWKLHLDVWRWERLTARNWRRFGVRRKDRKSIFLWDMRHAVWNLEHNMEDFYQTDMERVENWLGHRPDVKLIKDLYNFDREYELHHDENNYNVSWIYMDDIRIRFTEGTHSLEVMVEGGLAPDKVRLIKEHLIDKLSALVNSPCDVEEY